jgi:hypothetical protein
MSYNPQILSDQKISQWELADVSLGATPNTALNFKTLDTYLIRDGGINASPGVFHQNINTFFVAGLPHIVRARGTLECGNSETANGMDFYIRFYNVTDATYVGKMGMWHEERSKSFNSGFGGPGNLRSYGGEETMAICIPGKQYQLHYITSNVVRTLKYATITAMSLE